MSGPPQRHGKKQRKRRGAESLQTRGYRAHRGGRPQFNSSQVGFAGENPQKAMLDQMEHFLGMQPYAGMPAAGV